MEPKYSKEDILGIEEKVSTYLERHKQQSHTVQEICKELNIEDERLVTIILGKLEFDKKAVENDYDKAFEPDGCPILLPKFQYVEDPEKVFN